MLFGHWTAQTATGLYATPNITFYENLMLADQAQKGLPIWLILDHRAGAKSLYLVPPAPVYVADS